MGIPIWEIQMTRVVVQCVISVSIFLGAILALSLDITSAQSGSDIVLYAAEAPVKSGWNVISDSTAAGGARLANADLGAPKLAAPLAFPVNYFEMTFSAQAGTAYRLWIRGK